MAKIPKFERRCEKCGKPQPKDENKSNHNWNAFDCNAKCECGGRFVTFLDGERVTPKD